MTQLKSVALALLPLVVTASGAYAGTISGTADRIIAGRYGTTPYLIVHTSNTDAAQPSCSTAGGSRHMIIYLDSDAGREQAAIIRGAYFTGTPVKIFGSGTCTVHPGVEAAVDVNSPF